jgi:hypothetical protein
MKRKKLIFWFAGLFLIGSALLFNGCTKDDIEEFFDDDTVQVFLGWIGIEQENMDQIEDDIDLDDNTEFPSSVDLVDKFPPIGDQGQYGTCVAWAVGYNLKTAINGMDNGLSSSQLASASNQFSPKDLFWSIPGDLKGADCNGTGFEPALDVIQSRGIATLATVPYDGLGDCTSSPQSGWTSEAGDHKIENYRKIDINVISLKDYLAKGRPIAIGAKLGDNFMSWNSEAVLSSDSYNYNGQHAYHAMVLAGYDDSKGINGAFRVINSWNTVWGDRGYIWVDYNFFVNEFCFAAFVATNKKQEGYDPGNTVVNGTKDLVGWELNDYDYPEWEDPTVRAITYNVYNVGDETIEAREDWNILYVYYNAYNAEDYGILVYDYYSDDYGNYGEDGELTEEMGPIYGESNWWNHINVPGGQSVAEALYNDPEASFSWVYQMPVMEGYYYLVLIADGFDAIKEHDEANNFFYFTEENGDPIYIKDGIIQGSMAQKASSYLKSTTPERPGKYAASPSPTAQRPHNLNTYSTDEIRAMLEHHRNNGELRRKVEEHMAMKSGRVSPKAIKGKK